MGSGGTFVGAGKFFKEKDEGFRCFVVEPEGCEVLGKKGKGGGRHRLQGGGYERTFEELKLFNDAEKSTLVDGYVSVGDEEAMEAAR